MYNSLHMFLAHLNQAWHGLHLLVLIYLRKYSQQLQTSFTDYRFQQCGSVLVDS